MPSPGEGSVPELTAAVIMGAERRRAGRSLRHLLDQTAIDRMEIVCVDVLPGAEPVEESRAPGVRYVPADDCEYMDQAQVRCIDEARAPLIAFIEDHCYASRDWAANVIRAFDRPDVALVNYSFTYAGNGTYLDRAFLMTEYGRWMAPTRPGPVSIPSCNNVAYRVQALGPYRDSMARWMELEPVLHAEILRSGGVAWQSPDALVAHEDWVDLWEGCWANGVMKRMFGAHRSEQGGWGLPRRGLYAAAMTVAPGLHLARLAWSLRRRPTLWPAYAASLPVSVPVYVYSSFQEALGYLFGPGKSREQFTRMELDMPRQR